MTKLKFDLEKHKIILLKILKSIYTEPELRTSLGFKGGTAAYFFYQLPRASVDLDFDLLKLDQSHIIFVTLQKILQQFGRLQDAREKRFTIFFLVNYAPGERSIKLEVSKRPTTAHYQVRNYLGVTMSVRKPADMVAGKLAALISRGKFAARDLFDLWFFLKEDWTINEDLVKEQAGLSLKLALQAALKKIRKVKANQLLQGYGDLLDEERKRWVKEHLKGELQFLIKLYLDQIK